MTAPAIQRTDYYVYALLREDGITPFYIGKGRGYRVQVHERLAAQGTSHKDRIIQKIRANGGQVLKVKLAENLTDVAAKQIEIDLIRLIGRWPNGPLANLTKGGDGVGQLSEQSRAKKSARNRASWANPAVKERRVNGLKAAWTEEKKAAHSAQLRRPEISNKSSAAKRERWSKWRRDHPKEQKIKKTRSEIAKSIWRDPIKRKNMIAGKKQYAATHPIDAETAAKLAARLNTPELLARRLEINRSPEVCARRRDGQRRAFATPEAKARRSAASKKVWEKRRHQYAVPSQNNTES